MSLQIMNSVYEAYFVNEHGFYSDSKTNLETYLSYKNSNGKALFTADSDSPSGLKGIDGIVGNSEMVFFSEGNVIYRYHVFSKTVDKVAELENCDSWYPITSHYLLYSKGENTLPVCTNELSPSKEYYTFRFADMSSEVAVNPERLIQLTSGLGYTNLSSYSATVNGMTIPCSSYPIGTTFSGSYGGSTQCAGFALYAYNYIWGSTSYGTDIYPSYTSGTAANMAAALFSKTAGARVRVSDTRGSQNNGHSFILCYRDTSKVIVYHANWEGNNKVLVTQMTYSQLNSYFPWVYYVKNP